MTEKLKVINDFKKTILYLDKVVNNFPGNEKVLKDKISNSMYECKCQYFNVQKWEFKYVQKWE